MAYNDFVWAEQKYSEWICSEVSTGRVIGLVAKVEESACWRAWEAVKTPRVLGLYIGREQAMRAVERELRATADLETLLRQKRQEGYC